jgi:Flp pilus assembly protein protease CpaA
MWCLAWNSQGGRLGTLAGLVLLATLLTSAITDIARHRIFNWVTYSAMLWALALNIVATLTASSDHSLLPSLAPAAFVGWPQLGGVGIGECLAGAMLCFILTLVGYDLSGSGAGDVKLATVIGALLGVRLGIFAIAYSYVVAGGAIIVWTIWQHGPLSLLKAAFRKFGKLFGRYWPFPATVEDSKLLLKPIPLGPYFAIGTLLVVLELVPV